MSCVDQSTSQMYGQPGRAKQRRTSHVLDGATAQRALTAGLLDELEIHLIPVLLGEGRRLFEHLGTEQRELERVRVLEGKGGVTHLRYRVRRARI